MKSRQIIIIIVLLILSLAVACDNQEATPTNAPATTASPTQIVPEQPAATNPPVASPTTKPEEEPAPEPPRFDNLHVPSPNWAEQIIYFVMTDRFNDGDPGNNDQGTGEYDPADGRKYSGGDFQGIIDQLDYIQGLGATAVWITPPVANMWWDPLVPFGGYHGYWAENQKLVDAHLGELEDYQALSEALHDRGMYLIQDVVPNHMGNFFTYSDENGLNLFRASDPTANVRFNEEAVPDSLPSQPPFDLNDVTDPAQREAAIYHWTPSIADFGNEEQVTTFQLSDLDDLNTSNPVVREALRDSFGYWIETVGVDGFRVDTVRHVEHDFWNDFMYASDPAAPGMKAVGEATGRDNFFAFGEAFIGSDPFDDSGDRAVASYLGTAAKPELDGVLNFPLYFTINRVFAEGAPTNFLSYRLETAQDTDIYPDPGIIPTFIDNHDVSRFMAVGGRGGLKQASLFQMTIPGLPVIYYGSEQAFVEQRPAMFAAGIGSGGEDHFDIDSELYHHYQAVTALRKSDPIFTEGSVTILGDNETGPGIFAYKRELNGETVIIIFNTSDRPVLMSNLETGTPSGSVLEPLLALVGDSAEGMVVGPGGKLTSELPGRQGLVLRASGETVEVPDVEATITLDSAFAEETQSAPFEVMGVASQPDTPVKVIINNNLANALETTAGEDGRWSVVVPMDNFLPGSSGNMLFAYAPELQVASESVLFMTQIDETSAFVVVYDQLGDDVGPLHTYTLPTDETFGDQMDIEATAALAFGNNLVVIVKPAEITTVWDPANGFDHVLYHIFVDLPGEPGLSDLPRLNARAPEGFEWNYMAFVEGWSSRLYSTRGATAEAYGETVTPAPFVDVDPEAGWIVFLLTADALGNPDSLEGARIFVATWDWNGVDGEYRPLRPVAGQWNFGGGEQADPIIIDESEVIEVALDTRMVKEDPAGDDHGPAGLYSLPGDPAFGAQMDLRRASLVETDDGLRLDLEMGEISENPEAPNGFDRAMFNVFIDVPEVDGIRVLPFLNALAPAGLAWDYAARLDGWNNLLYTTDGAAADGYGAALNPATVTVDKENNMISLLFPPDPAGGLGLAIIDDIKLYVTTWDWDEEAGTFRELSPEGGPVGFGGGDGAVEPLILDDVVLGMATPYVSPFPPAAKVEVTLRVSVPEGTPSEEDLYLTGPFNQWAPKDAAYRFTHNDDGTFSLTFTLEEGDLIEYRIGRGTLANTEKLDPNDRFANRELVAPAGQESLAVEIEVQGWWDQ